MASASYKLVYPADVQRTRDASLDLLEKSGRPRDDFRIAMNLLVGDFDQGIEPGNKTPVEPSSYSYNILDILIILRVDDELQELVVRRISPTARLRNLVA
ncbi:hypothetical protein [Sphingosinicella sp.]|uniref:hypothetical protein n=1 Tax=Sphingosinicella sp. TaxID=1917971 RepID=UPI004037E84B